MSFNPLVSQGPPLALRALLHKAEGGALLLGVSSWHTSPGTELVMGCGDSFFMGVE